MRLRQALLAAAIGILLGSPAGAEVSAKAAPGMSLDEVVTRHIQARGGSRWDSIRSLRISGSFTAFSRVAPFTLERERDDKYRFDSSMNEKKFLVGFDGETAWWDNHWEQEGSQPIAGANLAQQSREFDFVTPFFDVARRGHRLELIGAVDYEGEPAIGISLTRSDGSVETWYLDPETFLELARTAPGSDFGTPMEQRTVFDDFRSVGGVMIPHRIETQWYTRDRILEIKSVELEVGDLDDARFRMPAPTGMAELQPLVGSWRVAVEKRDSPKGELEKGSERRSEIVPHLHGGLLEERFDDDGSEVIRTLSYDRFRKEYRLTEIESRATFLDIQEGNFEDAEGGRRLVVHNVETGTVSESFGSKIHLRSSIAAITEAGFRVEQEVSTDGGKTWWLAVRASYSRDGATEAEKR